ncbi:MAG: hypothetical protein FJ255_09755 [Phycisphaerae bacterium]|nr:hypothetical protein [Phycisphaerae bacterium]
MDWLVDLVKPTKQKVARRCERYRTTDLRCALGLIADLSASGMRVRADSKPDFKAGHLLDLPVSNGQHKIVVRARVAWVRKGAEGRYWIGLAFADTRAGIGDLMARLARYGYFETEQPQDQPRPPSNTHARREEIEDLYEILGVGRRAAPDEIHAAYRRLAHVYHPDVCKHADAGERMVRVNKAYAILKDEAVRKKYDALLRGTRAA